MRGTPSKLLVPSSSLLDGLGRGRGQAATRRTGEEQGTKRPNHAVSRMIIVPLARVTRGQPRLLGIIRVASSASLTGVTARLPKLIVRIQA
jgi:hypothetical protein